jgi:uncharacterized coiled-coil protein SlyX
MKTLEQRLDEIEKKLAELEKTVQPQEICIDSEKLALLIGKAIGEAIHDIFQGVQR